MTQERRRLTAEDWAEAALAAVGEGGIGAIAVEPLAAGLGATKGSFYWHFANRDALVAAALELWEQRHTERVISLVERHVDPTERLRTLFTEVITLEAANRTEVNLLAAADHPIVAPVVERVTRRRIGFVTDLLMALGFDQRQAHERALIAYTGYIGHAQLAVRLRSVLPSKAKLPSHVDGVLNVLLAPPFP